MADAHESLVEGSFRNPTHLAILVDLMNLVNRVILVSLVNLVMDENVKIELEFFKNSQFTSFVHKC